LFGLFPKLKIMSASGSAPLESPHTSSWSESSREYDAFEKQWHFYATVAEEVVRHLDVRPDSRVLELACGTGACTSVLARLCSEGEVVGLDLSEGMLEVARENARSAGYTNVRFVHGDAEDLGAIFGGESFDFAVCNSAFWHFPDGGNVLKGLSGLLSGLLTGPRQFGVSLPSWRSGSAPGLTALRDKIRELLLKYGVDPEQVERRFREADARRTDISALLQNSGFTILKDEAFQFEFPPEARERWRGIPVFARLPTRIGRFFSDLDPSVAVKLRKEVMEWRRQNAPLERGSSSWRILVASAGGFPR
jgi:SAM-dependent methyltransferase